MTALADDLTAQRLLVDLEPVVERELNRHLSTAKEWFPHEYIPWDEAENFDGPLGGKEWTPQERRFSEAARDDRPVRHRARRLVRTIPVREPYRAARRDLAGER